MDPGAEGIVPIACREIFNRIGASTEPDVTFKVEASMLEIYNEKVNDLFNPKMKGKVKLKVRDHPKLGAFIPNLTRSAMSCFEDMEKAMDAGTAARTVAATQMNATSSRAHTIFSIIITQTKVDKAAGKATDKVSCINLIDLAGSERAKRTGATGQRMQEGININQGLFALGNVINALGDPKKSGVENIYCLCSSIYALGPDNTPKTRIA